MKTLFTEKELAAQMGLSVNTLRHWRVLNKGPRFIRISRRAIRYSAEDVAAYLDGCTTGGQKRQEGAHAA